jgi:hypothetical protein
MRNTSQERSKKSWRLKTQRGGPARLSAGLFLTFSASRG